MVLVTKEEKDIIAEQYPYLNIVRTMKQKSKRHHYYVEENPRVMKLLERLRSGESLGAGTVAD